MTQIYGCTLDDLYGIQADEPHGANDHERQILHHMASGWDGDDHALIEFIGMYMAASPSVRAEIAGTSLRIFRDARNAGMHPDAPYDVRTHVISRAWGKLLEEE